MRQQWRRTSTCQAQRLTVNKKSTRAALRMMVMTVIVVVQMDQQMEGMGLLATMPSARQQWTTHTQQWAHTQQWTAHTGQFQFQAVEKGNAGLWGIAVES